MKKSHLVLVFSLFLLPFCFFAYAQQKPKSASSIKYFSFEEMRKEVTKNGGAIVALETQAGYYKRRSNNQELAQMSQNDNRFNPETALNTQMSSEYLCLTAVQNARLIQQNDKIIALLQTLAAKK